MQSSWDKPSGNSASFSDLLTNRLLAANPPLAAVFDHWLQLPGMGFQAGNLWWGEQKPRIAPHEGIDFVHYRDQQGTLHDLVPGLAVPTIFPGEIVHTQPDFLANSLYIRHDQFTWGDSVLHTVFAHLQPTGIQLSRCQVQTGETVAMLEKYPNGNTVPLHLHFSMAWILKDIPSHQLNWQLLAKPELVTLIDPLFPCNLVSAGVPGPAMG